MLDVVRQDYIRTARAKGLSNYAVLGRHALRNALIPLITILGMQLPHLVSTSVAVEVVFAWPGVGRLILTSLQGRDYPVVMGCFMMLAVLVVLGNLAADVLYGVVDPRIRYE
jgi:peptide/nickel transport system permease protein